MPKTAVIFDDHKMFAEILAQIIDRTNNFGDVIVCRDEEEVRSVFGRNDPQTIHFFCDYYLPGVEVYKLWQDIKLGSSCVKIIVISSLTNSHLLYNLYMHKDIDALISKTADCSDIKDCITEISNGAKYLSPYFSGLLENYQQTATQFTPRELEILMHIASGESIDRTAGILQLSRHTIVAHRRNMMHKVGCNSVNELLAFAIKNNFI